MLKSLKLLVVDDEALIRRAIILAAESRGHNIQQAANGQIALDIWPVFKPDLAFVDIIMPKLNGVELLKILSKNNKNPSKIIIISAHNKWNKKDLERAGADLFIQKPFSNIFDVIKIAENLLK